MSTNPLIIPGQVPKPILHIISHLTVHASVLPKEISTITWHTYHQFTELINPPTLHITHHQWYSWILHITQILAPQIYKHKNIYRNSSIIKQYSHWKQYLPIISTTHIYINPDISIHPITKSPPKRHHILSTIHTQIPFYLHHLHTNINIPSESAFYPTNNEWSFSIKHNDHIIRLTSPTKQTKILIKSQIPIPTTSYNIPPFQVPSPLLKHPHHKELILTLNKTNQTIIQTHFPNHSILSPPNIIRTHQYLNPHQHLTLLCRFSPY
jgi:hypothetical protein